MSNVREVPESRGSSPIDVLKQVASTGYLRKRAPQELVVFQGGADPVATLETLVPETRGGGSTTVAAIAATTAVTTGTVNLDARTKAKMQGYEGEACGECQLHAGPQRDLHEVHTPCGRDVG